MKFSQSCLAGLSLATSALARPAELFHTLTEAGASAKVQDVATIGYATMNGG